MIEGIDEAASRQGLTILLGLSRGDEAKREHLVTEFLERRVDGLLICAGADDHLRGRTPAEMPVPTVLIGQQPNPGFPIVVTDNVAAGHEVAKHLWSLGHRAFAYLAPDSGWHDFQDRQVGVAAFLRETGENYKLDVLDGIYSEADALSRVAEALDGGLAATAVIALDDLPLSPEGSRQPCWQACQPRLGIYSRATGRSCWRGTEGVVRLSIRPPCSRSALPARRDRKSLID